MATSDDQADETDGREQPESADAPDEPWHFCTVTHGAVVATLGPEPVPYRLRGGDVVLRPSRSLVGHRLSFGHATVSRRSRSRPQCPKSSSVTQQSLAVRPPPQRLGSRRSPVAIRVSAIQR